jgi:hypothetical protein
LEIVAALLSTIVAFPSSGATRHLLSDGEKNPESTVITSVPLPDGERVDRP